MIESYLSTAQATEFKTVTKPRLFATSKAIGNTQSITFHRDADDGSDIAVGPYDVLITMAGRAAQDQRGQPLASSSLFGEFRKEPPFPVHKDDRFCLGDGACGHVETAPIADVAFIRAPFILER
jgi:hypothetical protein